MSKLTSCSQTWIVMPSILWLTSELLLFEVVLGGVGVNFVAGSKREANKCIEKWRKTWTTTTTAAMAATIINHDFSRFLTRWFRPRWRITERFRLVDRFFWYDCRGHAPHRLTTPCTDGIVLGHFVIGVEKLFEPLYELKVILKSTLH